MWESLSIIDKLGYAISPILAALISLLLPLFIICISEVLLYDDPQLWIITAIWDRVRRM